MPAETDLSIQSTFPNDCNEIPTSPLSQSVPANTVEK